MAKAGNWDYDAFRFCGIFTENVDKILFMKLGCCFELTSSWKRKHQH